MDAPTPTDETAAEIRRGIGLNATGALGSLAVAGALGYSMVTGEPVAVNAVAGLGFGGLSLGFAKMFAGNASERWDQLKDLHARERPS